MNARLISIAAAVLMSGAAVFAQNPQGRGSQGGRQGSGHHSWPEPGQIAEMTATRIASEMALDEATTAKFVEVYKEYKTAMMAVMRDGSRKRPSEGQTFTDADAEAKILADFEKSRRIVDVREAYYNRFREFMTAKQMLKVYSLERNDAGHMRSEFDRRQPGVQPRQPSERF